VRRHLVSALVGLAALGGCSTGPRETAPTTTAVSPSSPSTPSAVLTLRCEGAIGGNPPSSDYETVLGVVALPTREAVGAYDSGDPTTPALFAKTGLLVRAGTPFELEVAPQPNDDVAIGWTNASFRPSARFAVPACPDTFGTGWLAYPGGYWADRPLCLPLTVRAAGREEQVHVGIGAPCPGQQPPVKP
jgi:hypothetical protein